MPEAYAQSWKDAYPAKRAEARVSRNGVLAYPNDQSAIETPEAERLAVYEQRWESGGTTFMAAFNDLIFNKASNDTASDFVRSKIRAMVKIRRRPSCWHRPVIRSGQNVSVSIRIII